MEQSRQGFVGKFTDTVIRDVRFGAHLLWKSPSFTITAVLTIAVAIGANSVVFSAVNGFILRPLSLPHEESLYHIERGSDKDAAESYPNYLDLRDRNRSFDGLAAEDYDFAWLNTGTEPVRASLYQVSGNYFDVLGIQPYVGRFFHAADEHGVNSAPYVVLTYAYWHTHFQDDRGIVGRTVKVNRYPFSIIGVAPPDFRGNVPIVSPDFFVPIVNQQQVDGKSLLDVRGSRSVQAFGHLKPGVTPDQALADLKTIAASLEKAYPKDNDKLSFLLTRTRLSGDDFDRPVHAFLIGLLVLSALILLAACANLGSLFAARAAERWREIALRLALGAGPARILQQLFTEAVLISVIGGAVGLWGSVLVLGWLSQWQPLPQFAIRLPIEPDGTVYVVALLLSVVSGFLFGAVPVRQVLRTDPHELIKSGARSTADRRMGIRDVLLAVQVALCAVLVTSSMVALRGLERSLHGNFGFEPRNALLVETDLALAGYASERIPAMQERMVEAMKAIPGVTAAGLIGQTPPLFLGWTNSSVFAEDAVDFTPTKAVADPITYSVSPDYFHAAETALLSGRTFTTHDDMNAPRVAVINATFARKVFGSVTNAVGRYFKVSDGTRVQVVGLVQDGKYTANLAEDAAPAVFFPILQSPSNGTWLVVRSTRDVQQLSAAVRSALRELDAGLPSLIETWANEMDGALFAPRIAAASLGVLGAMGAIVAITGIFGMAAFSLARQLKELGIRMALGAQNADVLRTALSRAFKLLAWGSGAGLVLGVLASRVLSFIVYEATPRDPLVLAGVVVAMMLVGLVATWIPARRALSLDPLTLLREE
jgi:predicted permease